MRCLTVLTIGFLSALLLACGGIGLAHDQRLVGDIGLAAADSRQQMAVVKINGSGREGLVPATVFAVGFNDSHVIAKRHPPDASGKIDKAITEYFIVTVHGEKVDGPLTEPEYLAKRKTLGVDDRLDFTLTFDDLK
jgi:hypothetical protein